LYIFEIIKVRITPLTYDLDGLEEKRRD